MPEIDVYTSNPDAQNLFPPKAAEYSALRFLKAEKCTMGKWKAKCPFACYHVQCAACSSSGCIVKATFWQTPSLALYTLRITASNSWCPPSSLLS